MVAVFALQRRYGLQLLPAFAACLAVLAYIGLQSEKWKPRLRFAVVLVIVAFVHCELCLVWRNHAYLPERSPDQHANAQPA